MKKMKGIEGKLDDAWSELVKLRAGGKCEICGQSRYLNSHHLFTRRNKAVRWDVDNGMALCPSHHVLDAKFSAHGTPIKFNFFLEDYKGRQFMELLTAKANTICKRHAFEKKILLDELNKEIDSFQ